MKQYALQYLKKGLSVIPIGRDKRPLLKSWMEYQNRLPTEQEVNDWWDKNPDANLGVICGKISNLTVVDFDIKKDANGNPVIVNGGVLHNPRVAEFRKTNAAIVRTGSGGYHFYYKYTPEIQTGVNVFHEEIGIDIRNDKSYVVAPPSIHANGKKYQAISTINELAELPLHLFGKKIKTPVETIVEGVSHGERNNTAAKMAGWLINKTQNGDREIAWRLFEAWNKQNNPPLSTHELKTVFSSISKREDSKPKELDSRVPEENVPILKMSEVAKRQATSVKDFIATGFKTLDEAMRGGMMIGDLNVFTGATGQGKTSICQTITYNIAKNKIPSLWFSFEVMIEEMWRKFIEMGVDDEFIAYTPLKIATGNVAWIEQKIKESKEAFGTKVVFIDHLGFLTKNINTINKVESMQNNFALYLSSVCRQLKSIAIDNEIVICLLVHTKKLSDKDNDTNINDIAYSAGIAQESDNVFMIRRVRSPEIGDDGSIYANESILKMEKNRRTGINKAIKVELKDGIFVERGLAISKADQEMNNLVKNARAIDKGFRQSYNNR